MEIEYYNYMVKELSLQPTDITLPTKKHQIILCLLCNNTFNATPASKLMNYKKYVAKGCPICSKNAKYKETTEVNIAKLNETFELLSDYGTNPKVELTVKNRACGHIFTTTKDSLLYAGVICPECAYDRNRERIIAQNKTPKEFTLRKVTREVFLQRLDERNARLPNRKVYFEPDQEYIKQESKYKFKCDKDHTWLAKGLNVIYNGDGCPKCKHVVFAERYTKPLEQVRNDILTIHADRYSYPNIENEYTKGATSKLTIMCKIHGRFITTVFSHIINESGCKKCADYASRLTQEEFVSRCKIMHNNFYTYEKTVYTGSRDKVIITCPVHGEFKQLAFSHIDGIGCSACSPTGYSKKAIKWLEFIAWDEGIIIQHADTIGGEYCIPNTRYKVDGYCVETNTVYEFYGDAYHGNPNRYLADHPCHPFESDKPASFWYEKTMKREQSLISMGYNVITIWESEFDKLELGDVK